MTKELTCRVRVTDDDGLERLCGEDATDYAFWLGELRWAICERHADDWRGVQLEFQDFDVPANAVPIYAHVRAVIDTMMTEMACNLSDQQRDQLAYTLLQGLTEGAGYQALEAFFVGATSRLKTFGVD